MLSHARFALWLRRCQFGTKSSRVPNARPSQFQPVFSQHTVVSAHFKPSAFAVGGNAIFMAWFKECNLLLAIFFFAKASSDSSSLWANQREKSHFCPVLASNQMNFWPTSFPRARQPQVSTNADPLKIIFSSWHLRNQGIIFFEVALLGLREKGSCFYFHFKTQRFW